MIWAWRLRLSDTCTDWPQESTVFHDHEAVDTPANMMSWILVTIWLQDHKRTTKQRKRQFLIKIARNTNSLKLLVSLISPSIFTCTTATLRVLVEVKDARRPQRGSDLTAANFNPPLTTPHSKQMLKWAFDSSQRALSITKNPVKHFLYCGCCSMKTTAALTETTPSQIFVSETQGQTQSRASHALTSAKTPAKTPTSPHLKSNWRPHSTIQFSGLKATTTLDDIDKNLRS